MLSDGGSSITAKGVVWSENPDPTVALPTKTDEGPGATNFRSQLTESFTKHNISLPWLMRPIARGLPMETSYAFYHRRRGGCFDDKFGFQILVLIQHISGGYIIG